ncbi:MAG TPA: Hpt domain-containing protein [Burkholderiales bacterium]|nr:Hpt domain-containing protein [Burkholderiales bacterium]
MQTERIEVRVAGELGTLVARYIANRKTELVELDAALSKRDFETLRRMGHVLKGSGGGFGFADISRMGDAIERAAVQGEVETLQQELAALKRYLECIYIVFE